MQDLNKDSSILIVGGFHTKGMTALLREQNISYIVLSANTNTDMDDELYHDLLLGKRKTIAELIPLAKDISKESLRLELLLEDINLALQRFGVSSLVFLPTILKKGAQIKDIFLLKEDRGQILEVVSGENNDFYIALRIIPETTDYVYLDLSKLSVVPSTEEAFNKAKKASEGRCVTADTLLPVLRREVIGIRPVFASPSEAILRLSLRVPTKSGRSNP